MPELIEVERYRRLAERAVGRRVVGVDAPDPWYLKGGLDAAALADAVVGGTVSAVRRHGKLLLVGLGDRPSLGLRFGMTGRLLLDGEAGLDDLVYGSSREEPAWDRFALCLAPQGRLVVRDPRRLGGVELEPDVDRLGPDAATVDRAELDQVLGASRAPLKARLADQSRLAGLGNLLTDEILWRAGLAPTRPAGALEASDRDRLHAALRATLAELTQRGGSHTGMLQAARRPGGRCPRDGTALRRDTVGGRSTWWCPNHQA